MADKYTKSLTIEEIEIKVIVRYDFVLIRLGKKLIKLIKDVGNRKSCIILGGV